MRNAVAVESLVFQSLGRDSVGFSLPELAYYRLREMGVSIPRSGFCGV